MSLSPFRPTQLDGHGVAGKSADAARAALIRQTARFTLPYFASVIVVSEGDNELLDLEGRTTWHFPSAINGAYSGPYPRSAIDAIGRLEELRVKHGVPYLLVPGSSLWLLEQLDDFRQHLTHNYRIAFYEEDVVLIFALHPMLDAEYRHAGAPDGLALPSPEMIALTLGFFNAADFYDLSVKGVSVLSSILAKHGREPGSFKSILDFGSGCGRIMRQWKHLTATRLLGADYNPYLVEWCNQTLDFADFEVARMPEGLSQDDSSVDLIYSLSVFTHLDPGSQEFWLSELTRVLEPGGLMYVTLMGESTIEWLDTEEKARFAAGEMVIRAEEQSGASSCAVYHPEKYVREILAADLEIVDYIPGGAEDLANQDVLLLRKPT